MPNLPSLPENANLFDVFRHFPKGLKPLLEYNDALLRAGDSDWSIEEREIIAAFVSAVNQCKFCYGAHKRMAQAFGFDESKFELIINDLEATDLSDQLKATLKYVEKLTKTPSRMTPEDAHLILLVKSLKCEKRI